MNGVKGSIDMNVIDYLDDEKTMDNVMGVSVCECVRDGTTFMTSEKVWMSLDDVCAPTEGELGYAKPMELLVKLILDKKIVYHAIEPSRGHIFAEVWVGNTNVNSYMRSKGYTRP